jgi:TPR repeat protein
VLKRKEGGTVLKSFLAGMVVTVVMASAALAGPYDDGLAAYNRNDYATALSLIRPLAEQGNGSEQARCQYLLAVMYQEGRGVPQDYVEAAKWYRLAGEQGHLRALENLAYMYRNGNLPKDDAEAVRWYRKAAELGDVDGESALGFAYEYGRGVPRDYVQAYMWLDLAAVPGGEFPARDRDELAAKMTTDQVLEAQRMAREWKPKTQP